MSTNNTVVKTARIISLSDVMSDSVITDNFNPLNSKNIYYSFDSGMWKTLNDYQVDIIVMLNAVIKDGDKILGAELIKRIKIFAEKYGYRCVELLPQALPFYLQFFNNVTIEKESKITINTEYGDITIIRNIYHF